MKSLEVSKFAEGLAYRAGQCDARAPHADALLQALERETASFLGLAEAFDRRDSAARALIHRLSIECPTPSSESRRLIIEQEIAIAVALPKLAPPPPPPVAPSPDAPDANWPPLPTLKEALRRVRTPRGAGL